MRPSGRTRDGARNRAVSPKLLPPVALRTHILTERVLLSPELVSQGRTYLRSMLDLSARNLAEKGVEISPDLIDVAAHLCVVEHTDRKRFFSEDRTVLFNEILTLYALNQPDTYRYSVSTAGAGGMIQMIPSTYAGIRQHHTSVGLNPDFVAGMRDLMDGWTPTWMDFGESNAAS